MRRILGNLLKINKIFPKMLENNDRIAVGLSGGKDSLSLLLALQAFAKKLNRKITIKAFLVHLDFNKQESYQQLENFLQRNKIDYEIITSKISQILNQHKKNNKIKCSFCSRMKKAILVRKALNQKFNKIALAHHLDDAIETLFMNLLNVGRIETFKPITYLSNNKIYLIRPFIFTREKEIIAFNKKQKLPIVLNKCPNNETTQRFLIKQFLKKNFYRNKNWTNSYKSIARAVKEKIIEWNKIKPII